MEPVIELGYTKIFVTPKSKGSKQLRNAVFTFASQFKSFPGKGMEKKTDITMKKIFNISNGSIADSLIKYKKNERTNKNGEPSRLLANRNIYFKNQVIPLVEIVIRDMIEKLESNKEIDSEGIKFFKAVQVVYIDYREDYEDIVEDMSKKLITIFGGKGGIKNKTVDLGNVKSTFKLSGEKSNYSYTSSNLRVRLRVFTIKGGTIPTEIQETGTTVIFNAVLRNNVRFKTYKDILKYGTTHKTREGLDKVFGAYQNRVEDWTYTYFEQQRSILDINKFADSSWAEFVYGDKSFTKFFTDMIKDAKRSDGTKVAKYTEWNPSDIWAAHRLKTLQDEIKKELKDGVNVVSKINNLLRGYFDRNELIGLSLKKIGDDKEAHVAFYNNNVNDLKLKIIEEYKFKDLIFNLNNLIKPNVASVYVYYGSDRKFTITAGRTHGGTLTLTSTIKGASAQAGQAIISMVIDLLGKKLKGKKMMFDKDIKQTSKYPPNYESWADKSNAKVLEEYKMMYNSLKSHFKNPPKFSDFLDEVLYETYEKDGAVDKGFSRNVAIKLLQIRFFYDVFNMKSDHDIIEFWQDLLYLAMKVDRSGSKDGEKGGRFEFAPFAKISDV
tara:strand:- start:55 stop:1878 length:1824 start_codon:yes stop_codon:yes gene_type:complete